MIDSELERALLIVYASYGALCLVGSQIAAVLLEADPRTMIVPGVAGLVSALGAVLSLRAVARLRRRMLRVALLIIGALLAFPNLVGLPLWIYAAIRVLGLRR